MNAVRYRPWREGQETGRALARRLADDYDRICEVGAGANPLLPPSKRYILLDISAGELEKAGEGYETIVADLCSPSFDAIADLDFVFSFWTAEHIADPARFHKNIRKMLRPGGVALHYFPTLYATPFVVNRVLPEAATSRILHRTWAERDFEGSQRKFPAYYRWCRGPSRRQIRRLEQCGFSVERYDGYFGHGYYYRLRLQPVIDAAANWLVRHPVASLTSFGLVVLRAR